MANGDRLEIEDPSLFARSGQPPLIKQQILDRKPYSLHYPGSTLVIAAPMEARQ